METAQPVRIALLEPLRVFRDCLEGVLARSGLTVVGAHEDVGAFFASLPIARPDVAVADLRPIGPSHSSAHAPVVLKEMHDKHPAVRLVVLSAWSVPDAESCYREGAAAYVDTATNTAQEVVRAVREVATGVRLFPFTLAPSGLHPQPEQPTSPLLDSLSLRERQVLAFIGGGADNLKISAHLNICERTVKAHVTNLYRKTNAENRTQLAILARELGLRPQPDWTGGARPA